MRGLSAIVSLCVAAIVGLVVLSCGESARGCPPQQLLVQPQAVYAQPLVQQLVAAQYVQAQPVIVQRQVVKRQAVAVPRVQRQVIRQRVVLH